MKKTLHIFTLILCLGIFLFPKQSFAMSSMKLTECCTDTDKTKDCCSADAHHTDQHSKEDCSNSCCNICHSYASQVFFSDIKESNILDKSFVGYKKAVYNYSQPYFSSLLQEIWQPPKIA